MKYRALSLFAFVAVLTCGGIVSAQNSPSGVGTTAANFLELGFDPRGLAMGDAVVSSVNDLSAIYWNPAGLAYMSRDEVFFAYQPWLVDTQTYLAAAGVVSPSLGTFAVGILGMSFGDMEVTTLDLQEGTGETFSPTDLAVNFSYGRLLTPWFGFGATAKFIHSSIFHSSASAVAGDLGVIIKTEFLSQTDDKDGLTIGMSLSNYGTRMQYGGLDLLRSIDISPDETGNFKDVKADLKTDSWELPLIFRVGVAVSPVVMTKQRLTIAVDALHANNNNESVNFGAEYTLSMPGVAKVFLRGGYRGLFLDNSEFGPTFGVGFLLQSLHEKGIQFDYTYRDIGKLGNTHALGFSFLF